MLTQSPSWRSLSRVVEFGVRGGNPVATFRADGIITTPTA